jgi:hypothetical protein
MAIVSGQMDPTFDTPGSPIMIMTARPRRRSRADQLNRFLPRLGYQLLSHTLPKNGWCRRHLLYRIFAAMTSIVSVMV